MNESRYPSGRLSSFLTLRKEFIAVEDGLPYKRIRIQLHNRGIVVRDRITGFQLRTKKQQVVREGDLVVAEIDAKVGGFGIVPKDLEGAIVSSHYFVYTIDETVCLKQWLDHFIHIGGLESQVSARGSTNYASIRPADVLDYVIPLPPVTEQQRVVAKLDGILDRTHTTKQELSRMPELTRRLRMAILSKAFRGELTKRGADTLQAADLLSEIRRMRVSRAGKGSLETRNARKGSVSDFTSLGSLPRGWQWTTIGELMIDSRYGTSVKCSGDSKGIPVLRIPNIVNGLDLSDLKYARLREAELKSLQVQDWDVLVVRTNGSLSLVGRSVAIKGLEGTYAFASYLIRVRLPEVESLPEYIALVINSEIGRTVIESRVRTTAGQYNLNTESIKSVPIPLPPAAELGQIVSLCNNASLLCSRLDKCAELAEDRIKSLQNSILNLAFQGRLMPDSVPRTETPGRQTGPRP